MRSYLCHPSRFLPVLLGVLVVLAHGVGLWNDFVRYDDGVYITENARIQQGLSWATIAWAFTNVDAAIYQPLPWISFALDWTFYGANPAGFHATAILLHLANVMLLYAWLRRVGLATTPAFFAAGLLALHPLHVESVAWAASRKDVLSLFFGLLTLHAYHGYRRQPSRLRYAAVALALFAALGSKPSVVTLPFVLVLLDIWPYRSIDANAGAAPLAKQVIAALREKLPLIAMALLFSMLALAAQRQTLGQIERLSLPLQAANALHAYLAYWTKAVVPLGLATPYPWSREVLTWWRMGLSATVLVAVTAMAGAYLRRAPWLLVGWLWTLGAFVPMIGFVPFGAQAYADRFAYFPFVGLYLAIGATLDAAWRDRPSLLRILAPGVALVLVVFGTLTFRQTMRWRDTETLFQHTLSVMPENSFALTNVGREMLERGDYTEAIVVLEEALRLSPGNRIALTNLGAAYLEKGEIRNAIACFVDIEREAPDDPENLFNLAVALAAAGEIDVARNRLHVLLELDPANARARALLERLGSAAT